MRARLFGDALANSLGSGVVLGFHADGGRIRWIRCDSAICTSLLWRLCGSLDSSLRHRGLWGSFRRRHSAVGSWHFLECGHEGHGFSQGGDLALPTRQGPLKLAGFGPKPVHPTSKAPNYVVIVGVGHSVDCLFLKASIEVVDAAFRGDFVGPELAANRDFGGS
jgi:hypothetical protein